MSTGLSSGDPQTAIRTVLGVADTIDLDLSLVRAARHVERARGHLGLDGEHAVRAGRAQLEVAVALLAEIAGDEGLERAARRPVERWRSHLASHLLAAADAAEAGAATRTVAQLLRRATDPVELRLDDGVLDGPLHLA